MFCFSETDITEQKKYEKRKQTSMDNTINYLRYEIKFKNIWNVRNISNGDIFFKITKNLILGFFAEADTKKHASAKNSNAALVNLLTESLKMIMRLITRCFSGHVFL